MGNNLKFFLNRGGMNPLSFNQFKSLENLVSFEFGLQPNSFYLVSYNPSNELVEFVYPNLVKGNLIPLHKKNPIIKCMNEKKPFYTNNYLSEKGLASIDCLLSMGKSNIKKMMAYPFHLNEHTISAILLLRRETRDNAYSPDFDDADFNRTSIIINNLFNQNLAETA